jgi:hypothetical protein
MALAIVPGAGLPGDAKTVAASTTVRTPTQFGSAAHHLLSWAFPLSALAFLACAFLLPSSARSTTHVDLAQLLDRARAETKARMMRAPDGTPLCFPPAGVVEGSKAHIVPAFTITGGDGGSGQRELPGYVDVYLEQTEAPILLILRAHDSIIWRLHLSEDARLRAVHLMAYVENFVVGVPKGVPVTSRFRNSLEGGEEEYCVFADTGPDGAEYLPPKGMVDDSRRFSERYDINSFAYVSTGGPQAISREVRFIRRQLHEYAGVPVFSYPGWIEGRAEVSRRGIKQYEAVRQRGRDWLDANKPPVISTLGPDAEMMDVPEALTNVAAMEWLAERGYAERTGRDVVEYLCGRRLALALLEGEDVFWEMAIQNCAERQYSSKLFTVLGSIRITEENCKATSSSDYAALLIPPDVQIDLYSGCTWPRFEYPRDGENE